MYLICPILSKLSNICKKYNCHIMCLHHANKGAGSFGFDTIMGSTAFRGAVDVNLSITVENGKRFIESEGRYGTPLVKTELKFDKVCSKVDLGLTSDEIEQSEVESKIMNYLHEEPEGVNNSELPTILRIRRQDYLASIKKLEKQKRVEKFHPNPKSKEVFVRVVPIQ